MNNDNVITLSDREKVADPLTELLRSGARKLIEQAIESELSALLDEHADRRTEAGHAA